MNATHLFHPKYVQEVEGPVNHYSNRRRGWTVDRGQGEERDGDGDFVSNLSEWEVVVVVGSGVSITALCITCIHLDSPEYVQRGE